MRKIVYTVLAVLVITGGAQWSAVQAQTTNVTFILNTATVPDTIPVMGSHLQIRGGLVNAGTSPITWGNDTVNNMVNIGGDYWTKTLQLNAGDTLKYKFVVGYLSGTGWEQNTTPPYAGMPADNRYFIVPAQPDTTVPLEFWNNGAPGRLQYFRPWDTEPSDSISVYVRVNMLGPITTGTFSYNNNTDTVGVRGGGYGDLNWSPTFYLTKESAATNGDGYTVPANTFWSGRLKIPKDSVNEGQSVAYKFLIGFDWGRDELQGKPNRSFTIPVGKQDTTLAWVFFNNERPSARVNNDTCYVTYRANLAKALQTGGFSLGDTLYVRSGYFGTAQDNGRRKEMVRSGGSTYIVQDTIITTIGKSLDYQYYALKNAVEIRENYYNFYYSGDQTSEAEKRQITVPGQTFTIADTAVSITNSRREPIFANSRALDRNVLVKYEVDVRPVFYQVMKGDTLHDIQGLFNIDDSNKDSVLTWGVWMNGLAVGSWSNPGGTDWDFGLLSNPDKKMFDDGTNGDLVPGDTIFTRDVLASPDSVGVGSKWQVGQTFKFGVRGGDNEGGKGGYGNNHIENILDTGATYTMLNQFGSINPAFYNAWDYDCHCPAGPQGVKDGQLPLVYSLKQNYPNPFNPSTVIEYSVPTAGFVTLKVFNVLGQQVMTLVNENKIAGGYRISFNAANLPSGMYFYRITAGKFTSTKKMMFIK